MRPDTKRAERRHHRARRIAAVVRQFRAHGIDVDCDGHPSLRWRMRADTRTPCSCYVCKCTRQQRSRLRDIETRRDTAFRDSADQWAVDERYDSETREMLDEYAELFAALAPLVRANGGAWSPFGESGYDDEYRL